MLAFTPPKSTTEKHSKITKDPFRPLSGRATRLSGQRPIFRSPSGSSLPPNKSASSQCHRIMADGTCLFCWLITSVLEILPFLEKPCLRRASHCFWDEREVKSSALSTAITDSRSRPAATLGAPFFQILFTTVKYAVIIIIIRRSVCEIRVCSTIIHCRVRTNLRGERVAGIGTKVEVA